jgi:hypothetical protein
MDVEYYLIVPYGKDHNKMDLTYEFKLKGISDHPDCTGRKLNDGTLPPIEWIRVRRCKQLSFVIREMPPPNYLSVFSSAAADRRLIPYAYLDARIDKNGIDTLSVLGFRVSHYNRVISYDGMNNNWQFGSGGGAGILLTSADIYVTIIAQDVR